MRYAIISDVHSNIEAFKAVLSGIHKESADKIVFLGDIIGYGPDPNECIKEIIKIADITIAGNHDHAAIGLMDLSYFNPYARDAIEWTMGKLTEGERSYLSKLPLTAEIASDDVFLVHATPKRPQDWNYIFTENDAVENFGYFKHRICFIGHSHVPVIIVKDKYGSLGVMGDEIEIKTGYRYIINAGSIGQPRDGNPASAYALYDSDDSTVSIKRVPYDYSKTQEKMKKAGLSPYLIERLAVGH